MLPICNFAILFSQLPLQYTFENVQNKKYAHDFNQENKCSYSAVDSVVVGSCKKWPILDPFRSAR